MDARRAGSRFMSSEDPLRVLGRPAKIALYVAVAGMLAAILVSAASPLILASRDAPGASAGAGATPVRPAVDRKRVFDERRQRFAAKAATHP